MSSSDLPPLLFIHGMCGTAQVWERFVPFFEALGYTCHAPNLRDHAPYLTPEQQEALGSLSVRDYVDDLEQLIRSLPRRPIVIGHSMGSLLTQLLAERGLATAAVLVTSAPPAGILALKPSVLLTFSKITNRWNFWKKTFRFDPMAARYGIYNNLPPAQQKHEHAQLVDESGRTAFEIGYWFIDRKHATRVDAKKVTCPMLVLGAAKDRITPVSVVRQIAQKYPQATYKEYAQFAHFIPGEAGWQTAAQDIADWIKAQPVT